jgi:hypothetical protein
MLIEKEIEELANKKEYVKVFNYFHDEYTDMMREYLTRHDVKLNDNDCLINYIIKARCFTPTVANYTIPISKAMYNEELPEAIKYDLLINSYPVVKDVFSK